MSKFKLGVVIVLCFLFSLPANSHQISQSFSNWTIEERNVTAIFSVAPRYITLLPVLDGYYDSLEDQLSNHLKKNIKILSNEKVCEISSQILTRQNEDNSIKAMLNFECPENGNILSIENKSFFDASAGHIHFARIKINSNDWEETIFTSTRKKNEFSLISGKNQQSALEVFFDYIKLGFEHILLGFDHLAFLMTLLLISLNLKKVFLTVTGFTIGHSVTLALAALGLIKPSTVAIEALIGFTILLVASQALLLENEKSGIFLKSSLCFLITLGLASIIFGGIVSPLTWIGLIIFTISYAYLVETKKDAEAYNPALTLVFGLIHGFGFASVLLELGLPKGKTVSALFGFNLGVELGQILVVVLAISTLYVLGKTKLINYKENLYNISALLLVALGTFWFVGRIFSL